MNGSFFFHKKEGEQVLQNCVLSKKDILTKKLQRYIDY